MLKNKKAIELLGEHTVNLIIAVLCIVVLVFLGILIYQTFFSNSKELQHAQADLDAIFASMDSLQKIGDVREVIVYNPKGWAVSVQDDVIRKPISCGEKACLCICEYDSNVDKLFANCNNDKTGICKEFETYYINLVGDSGEKTNALQINPNSGEQMTTLVLTLAMPKGVEIKKKPS